MQGKRSSRIKGESVEKVEKGWLRVKQGGQCSSNQACVWSLQSVLCSYIFSLNLFSTLSLCIFTLSPMCMCAEGAEGPGANSRWDLFLCVQVNLVPAAGIRPGV